MCIRDRRVSARQGRRAATALLAGRGPAAGRRAKGLARKAGSGGAQHQTGGALHMGWAQLRGASELRFRMSAVTTTALD
eukprot:4841893-Prymnesium_polylepis.2